MALFSYKARNLEGELFEGTLEVENKREVSEFLDKQQYFPIDIKEQKEASEVFSFMSRFRKLKTEEITNFTKQLSTLLRAGVPIVASLESLYEQTENEDLRNILRSVINDVSEGTSFSEALEKQRSNFSDLYVNMIRAGESAGVLEGVLDRLASFMDHDESVRKSIKSAMRYPIIVFTALILAFFFAVTFIIPKFTGMFERSGVELPFITKVLIGTNVVVTQYWYFALATLAAIFFLIKKILATKRGRLLWDRAKLNLPIFGPLFSKNAISRFAHMLETLNMSGIHIVEALEICANTSGNEAIGQELNEARDGVIAGSNLADSLEKGSLIPPMTIKMIRTGQDSGSLDTMLASIYDQYDAEVDYITQRLSAMVEPMMTVIIGVFILIIALGIFLPMWGMYDAVK